MACSGLLRIPTELQHMIADLAGRRAILALRSVCRDLLHGVDEPFLKSFYSKRRHLITPYSLQCLVGISKDSRLRRQLKEVEFVITDLAHWIREGDYAHLGQPVTEEDIKEKKDDEAAMEALFNRWAVERHLNSSEPTLSLITSALTNLAAADIVPTITLGSNPILGEVAYGTRQLATKLDPYPALYTTRLGDVFQQGLDNDTGGITSVYFRMLLEAVSDSSLPVKRLTISDCRLDSEQPSFKALDLVRLKTGLRSLTSLTVSLRSDGGHERVDENMSTFSELMLEASPPLHELKLDYGTHARFWDLYVQSDLSASLCSEDLHSLTVTGGLFTPQSLRKVLAPHADSLKRLTLSYTALRSADEWQEMFMWIAETMDLAEATIYALRLGATHCMANQDRLHAVGKDVVKTKLLELSRNIVFKKD